MKYRFLIAALLLSAFSMTVYAHETPDESRNGTITVEMKYDGKAVTGGKLLAYRVARLVEEDGSYGFEALAPYEVAELSQENLNTPELAAAFAGQLSGEGITPAAAEDGLVSFENLELGLYLIVQTEACDGFETLKPFLVSVPMNVDGHYVYEVNAEGKFQLHQQPEPTAPTESPEPDLPQTGQLNWPIPALAALGLCLFCIGCALRFVRKKNSDEK